MNSWVSKGILAAVVALPALSGVARAGGGDDFVCSNATLQGNYAFSVLTVTTTPGVPSQKYLKFSDQAIWLSLSVG
jgi:hypothetical protein